ncbi:MAG: hypothetical protein HYX76_16080, partial [Acidobacteria bacterium]|nr:hypothetical protein [Acidobacteriota bacterium]
WQISPNGGSQPQWRRDGKELFYIAADHRLMAVAVKSGAMFEAAAPTVLFETRTPAFFMRSDYSASADGQRFVVNTRVREGTSSQIVVLTKWTAALRQ